MNENSSKPSELTPNDLLSNDQVPEEDLGKEKQPKIHNLYKMNKLTTIIKGSIHGASQLELYKTSCKLKRYQIVRINLQC